MQRKFVREKGSNVPSTNFYGAFREWIDLYYTELTDEVWDKILEEDSNVDYSITGSGVFTEEEVIEEALIEQEQEYANESSGDQGV